MPNEDARPARPPNYRPAQYHQDHQHQHERPIGFMFEMVIIAMCVAMAMALGLTTSKRFIIIRAPTPIITMSTRSIRARA